MTLSSVRCFRSRTFLFLVLLTASTSIIEAHSARLRRTVGIIQGAFRTLWPKDTLYWNWSDIDLNNPQFLQKLPFLNNLKWGFADSDYQVSGPYLKDGQGKDKYFPNDWTEWEKGEGHIAQGDKIGHACDRPNLYEKDFELMRQSGGTVYRCSIDWSKIEPEPGKFNKESMDFYKKMIEAAQRKGLKVTVCCWHHTMPLWATNLGDANKGGWENPAIIPHFKRYATYVFEQLHDTVKSWMTLNEPVGYAMGSYYVQDNLKHPPAKHDLKLCGTVVANLLQAHCECYEAFKAIDPDVVIGFSHVIQHIDPYHRFNIVERMGASIFNYLVNDAALNFFLTGTFKWSYPWRTLVKMENKNAPGCLDKLWVNYYSHSNICMLLRNIFKPKEFIKPRPRADKKEAVTDNGQVIYAEGLYRAIQKCARLKIPLAIGECGLADNDDKLKALFIKQHLYALSRAIQDGYEIDEVYWWTFLRNWEWAKGYTESFGLWNVNLKTQERTLYPGAQEFIDFMRSKSPNLKKHNKAKL